MPKEPGSSSRAIHESRETRTTRKAWLESGLTAFFLKSGWMNLTLWVIAAKLVEWWPRIAAQAGMIASGEGFLVPVRGTKFEKIERR